ncbi:hypothetical protein SPRG_00700 [Saprolegnia parasitica CBS 223.65]|uniref:CSC1/OSCA1-like 7TM region domain-containing protein n=1 Tax=Saprolegnia parasitica (strain CBS 223.65) TaxID=695850 RepID=A0A067CVW4_SAPPC|nr:hypothetical protein SPRG_00700 [Saprolegnia parasitica CBS 223.65]KDO34638.1 hypothetical protein SPRG_00700 [Saprolegnia parasitica CBS 223.65]|eukprot:XP_012194313.1 hypothetical protein SPRG_00700 [Saprolegnia parasitica CBS 223.65]
MLLLRLALVAWTALAALADVGKLKFPSGSLVLVVGGNITTGISCDPPPASDLLVKMILTSRGGAGAGSFPVITPNPVRIAAGTFRPSILSSNTAIPGANASAFNIVGHGEGRYYIQYHLAEGPSYETNHDESVILVLNANDGWEGIWFQVQLNVAVFGAGFLLFLFRRVWPHLAVPFWNAHREGLFEKFNYEGLTSIKFQDKYASICAPTVCERLQRFFSLPCDSKDVVDIAGVDAALSMHLQKDMAHFFAIMSVLSIGVLMPIHYVSGRDSRDGSIVAFQQTTIGNVPLQSPWYWGHVAMQNAVGRRLHVDATRMLGARSILIHAGLPKEWSSYQLKRQLATFFPVDDIKTAVAVHDLQALYRILDERVALRSEYNRLLQTYAKQQSGTLPSFMLWCPGSFCCPSIPNVFRSYTQCLPCKALCCARSGGRNAIEYSPNHSGDRDIGRILELALPRDRQRAEAIRDRLNSFPKHVLELYAQRRGTGAAFVVFRSTEAKGRFLELVAKAKRSKKMLHWPQISQRDLLELEENAEPQDLSVLKPLVVQNAPEPQDVNWTNLTYQPRSIKRFLKFIFYQCTTLFILVVFSTPTAVLIYVNLDNDSPVYKLFTREVDNVVTKFITAYLPSLMLIIVNWCLLTCLFYTSFFEPWLSESERQRSFLRKGFAYLLLSSIILPSIGVTAVYLANGQGGFDRGSEVAYVEKFMFQLCRNFFIAYVCQRAFLGSIFQLLRIGERLVYQPWLKARAITAAEMKAADLPWPFYYGYDYSIVLSVFMVALLGIVLSPLLTPFGALYFYMKFYTMKYNLIYVHPRSSGRGDVARSAYNIVFVCLLIFEACVLFVILEVGQREQFLAMALLMAATIVLYFSWWQELNQSFVPVTPAIAKYLQKDYKRETAHKSLVVTTMRQGKLADMSPDEQLRYAFGRLMAMTAALREKDEKRAYINPYDAGLKVFSCLYTQQQRCDAMEAKRYAFQLLKRKTTLHTK